MSSGLSDGQPMVEYRPELISLSDSQQVELDRLINVVAINAARVGAHEALNASIKETVREVAKETVKEVVKEVLDDMKLTDEDARRDWREMRDLLSAWRSTKQEMWRTIVKITTTAVLGVIAAAVWMYSGRS